MTSMSSSTRVGRAVSRLAVVLLCLVLAGCYKVELDLTVHSDDTISGTMIFGITRDLPGGGEILNQMRRSLPAGTEVEDWDDERFIGFRITYDNAPIGALGSDSRATGSSITLRRDGDFYILGDPSAAPDPQDLSGFTPVYLIRFTFPGDIVEGNGVEDGRSMEWTDPSISPYAKAEVGGSSVLPIVLIGLGAAVVVTAVIVAVIVMRSRSAQPALAGGPSQHHPQATSQNSWGQAQPAPQAQWIQQMPPEQWAQPPQQWGSPSPPQSWSAEPPEDGESPWSRP